MGELVFRFSGSSSPNEFYAALSVWEAPLFVAAYPTDNSVLVSTCQEDADLFQGGPDVRAIA